MDYSKAKWSGKRGIPVNKVGKKISSQSNWKPPKSLQSRYGREVAVGLTGYDALKKLQQEGEGYIHAAFHRSDIGDIDAVWGNPDSYGISHVIKRRGAENVDLDGFLKQISETIENGEIKYDEKRNNYNILYKRQMIIVSKEYDGENVHLIVTGFRTRKKKLQKSAKVTKVFPLIAITESRPQFPFQLHLIYILQQNKASVATNNRGFSIIKTAL